MYDGILRCSDSESSVALSYERLTMEIIAQEIGAEPSFTFDFLWLPGLPLTMTPSFAMFPKAIC